MNIINESNEKGKKYLPNELKTRLNAVKAYGNGNSIDYVCRKYHTSRIALYGWNEVYNGTKEACTFPMYLFFLNIFINLINKCIFF